MGSPTETLPRAKTKDRTFSPGDNVLLFLPQEHNKLQVAWRGPYDVIDRSGGQNYKIRVDDKEKLYHPNLLKRYHPRERTLLVATVVTEEGGMYDTIPSYPLNSIETFKEAVLKQTATSDTASSAVHPGKVPGCLDRTPGPNWQTRV